MERGSETAHSRLKRQDSRQSRDLCIVSLALESALASSGESQVKAWVSNVVPSTKLLASRIGTEQHTSTPKKRPKKA